MRTTSTIIPDEIKVNQVIPGSLYCCSESPTKVFLCTKIEGSYIIGIVIYSLSDSDMATVYEHKYSEVTPYKGKVILEQF